MRMLYQGFEVAQEQAEEHAGTSRGMSSGDKEAFAEFAEDANSA